MVNVVWLPTVVDTLSENGQLVDNGEELADNGLSFGSESMMRGKNQQYTNNSLLAIINHSQVKNARFMVHKKGTVMIPHDLVMLNQHQGSNR